MSVMGTIAGPLAGLLLLGVFFPRANRNGAFVAVLMTVPFFVFCTIGQNINQTYRGYSLPTNFTCDAGHNVSHYSNYSNTMSVSRDYDPHYGKPGVFFAFRLSSFSYGPLSIAMIIIVGYVVSVLVPQKTTPYQQKLAYSLTYLGRNTFTDEQLPRKEQEMLLIQQK